MGAGGATYVPGQLVFEAAPAEQAEGQDQLILVVLLNDLMRTQQLITGGGGHDDVSQTSQTGT